MKGNSRWTFLMPFLVLATLAYGGAIMAEESGAEEDGRTITVIQHPGYFETLGDVYNIMPGEYVFVVVNKSNKDAGFVLARKGEEPIVISIKDGDTSRLKALLKSGKYSYFCPMIPTPSYQITVADELGVLPPAEKENDTVKEPARVSPDEAYMKTKSRKALLVCAYDSDSTFKRMQLQGAISLNEFKSRLPSLSKEQEIVFYCA